MVTFLNALAWGVCFLAPSGCDSSGSFLYSQAPSPDGCVRLHAETYVPQAGDLVFFDDHKLLWRFLDALAFSGPPDHNGIVVRMPDGSHAILESAPDGDPYVELQDVVPRLRCYKGTVWVRRLKCPLSAEQSARLTCFAFAQLGKRYARVRLALQITPFRARGPLRHHVLGHTFMNRHRWYCSEIVVAAGTAAGLFDPQRVPANITYPRDLFDNRFHDLSCVWHDARMWRSCPPTE